jgi:hypothetical protein
VGKFSVFHWWAEQRRKFLIDDLKENLEYISANTVYVLQPSNYLHFPYKILLKENDA